MNLSNLKNILLGIYHVPFKFHLQNEFDICIMTINTFGKRKIIHQNEFPAARIVCKQLPNGMELQLHYFLNCDLQMIDYKFGS